jgi:endonuclease-3
LASAKIVVEKYSGKVPDTMEELTALPGIARKSANIILSNAYGKIEGIAVDTHVLRLSQRLRLIDLDRIGGKHEIEFLRSGTSVVDYKKDADPVKVERELMGLVARSDWFLFTYLLIDHGRAICKAKNPDCGTCTVRAFCPSSRV